jgi:hypothetical protein
MLADWVRLHKKKFFDHKTAVLKLFHCISSLFLIDSSAFHCVVYIVLMRFHDTTSSILHN